VRYTVVHRSTGIVVAELDANLMTIDSSDADGDILALLDSLRTSPPDVAAMRQGLRRHAYLMHDVPESDDVPEDVSQDYPWHIWAAASAGDGRRKKRKDQ